MGRRIQKLPKFDHSHIILNRKKMEHVWDLPRLNDFINPAMRARALKITMQDWAVDHVLDQGSTPHCVGFAWATFGVSLPVFDDWQNDMGDKIYYAAKVIDGEPNQEDGSTTLSGVKAFMEFGQLQNNSYAFASSLQDIVTWLLTTGPVVTGTDWLMNMFYPDADGLVHVDYANDSVAGGHEWNISGVDTVSRQFHCTNSWGASFGVNGHFKIGFDDYVQLLSHGGDAATAAEIGNTPVPPTPTPTPSPVPTPNGCTVLISKIFG